MAARVPKKVLQMAGIDDCYTASRGSTKTLGNFVKVHIHRDCPLALLGWRARSARAAGLACKKRRAWEVVLPVLVYHALSHFGYLSNTRLITQLHGPWSCMS